MAGAAAMVMFNHVLASTGFGDEDRGDHHEHRRRRAKPNDTDGTISDEPASIKVARVAGEALTGRPLEEREKRALGSVVHHMFGALAGAVYGAASTRAPVLTTAGGLPYGAAVWLLADEIGLPMVSLARRPSHYPAQRHAAALATHLVFGLTVESVRRLLIPATSQRHSKM